MRTGRALLIPFLAGRKRKAPVIVALLAALSTLAPTGDAPRAADVEHVATMALLSGYNAAAMAMRGTVVLDGYYPGSTDGSGIFTWQAVHTGPPDGGVVIAPSDHPGTCAQGCMVRQIQGGAINFEMFGARGNTRDVVSPLTISSGSPNLAVASGLFVPADQGKTIVVFGAGHAGGALATTIVSVQDATHAILAAKAATTMGGTSGRISYGTDDSAALNTATRSAQVNNVNIIAACKTYGIVSEWRPYVASAGHTANMNLAASVSGANYATTCPRGNMAVEWIGTPDEANCGATDTCRSVFGLPVSVIGSIGNSNFSNIELNANCLIGHALGFYSTDTLHHAERRQMDRVKWNYSTFENGTTATILLGLDHVTANSGLVQSGDIAVDTWEFDNDAFQSSCATTAPHVKMTGFNIYNVTFRGGSAAGTAPFAGNREFYFVAASQIVMDGMQWTPMRGTSDIDTQSVIFSSNGDVTLRNVQSEDPRLLYNDGFGDHSRTHTLDRVTINNVNSLANVYSYKNISGTRLDCRASSLYTYAGKDYFTNLRNDGPTSWRLCRLSKSNSGALMDVGRSAGIGSVDLNGPLSSLLLQNANFNFQAWSGGVPAGYPIFSQGGVSGTVAHDTSGAYSENGKNVAGLTCTSGCSGFAAAYGLQGPAIPVANLTARAPGAVPASLEVTWFGTTDGALTPAQFAGLIGKDSFGNGGSALVGGNSTIVDPATHRFAAVANYTVTNSGTSIIPFLVLIHPGTLHVNGMCAKVMYGGQDFSPSFSECRMTPSVLANR